MLPYTSLSNDHYPGTNSSPLELQFSRFDVASSPGYAVGSLGSTATSPVSRFESLIGLNLIVYLSFYPLQEHASSTLLASSSMVRRHPMVHFSRLPKTKTLTASSTLSTSRISWALSHSTYEPIMFFDVDRY